MLSSHRVAVSLLAPVVLLVVAAAPDAAADEKPHPLVVKVKGALKDTSRPFTMLVIIQVKEGAEAKFEAAFAKAIAGTRTEKGNLAYQLNRSATMAGHYIVYERWQNLAALEAHMKSAHIAALRAATGDLRMGASEVKVYVPAGEPAARGEK
jgi:quinol monooxygenase YgiN